MAYLKGTQGIYLILLISPSIQSPVLGYQMQDFPDDAANLVAARLSRDLGLSLRLDDRHS